MSTDEAITITISGNSNDTNLALNSNSASITDNGVIGSSSYNVDP